MTKATRREIRSLLHTAEIQLPKGRAHDQHRDLFAQAAVSVWEGKPGRSRLVSCVRRLDALVPDLMAPVIERLFRVLTVGEPRIPVEDTGMISSDRETLTVYLDEEPDQDNDEDMSGDFRLESHQGYQSLEAYT